MVDFLLHNKNLITTVLWLFSDENLNHFIDNLLFPACAFYTIKLRYLPTDSQSLSVHIPNEINEETRGELIVVQQSVRKFRSNRKTETPNLIRWNGNGIYGGKTIRSTRKFIVIIMRRHVNRTEIYFIHSPGLCPDLPTFCRLRAFDNFLIFC